MTILISYLFYFVAASVSPLQRRWLAKKKNVDGKEQVHFAFQTAFVIVILSLLLPFFQTFKLVGEVPSLIILSLISGIFGAIAWSLIYLAQKHVESGITTLIINIYTPITIVLATFLLNEKLTMLEIIGTIFLLIGMVIVSKKHKTGRFSFDKYFLFMLLAGVMLGVVLTAERTLQKETGFTAGTMLSWWSQCLFLGIGSWVMRSRSKYSMREIALTGSLKFLQSLSWVILLFVVGNLSVVSSITTFKVVVVFVAAAIFLKEREDLPRKIIGSLVALGGLLLMK